MARWWRRILLGTFLVLLGFTVLSAVRAVQVKADLEAARLAANTLEQRLLEGDTQFVGTALPRLRQRATQAVGRTSGPIWGLTEQIPLIGNNFQAVRDAATAVQIVASQALPEVEAAVRLSQRERVIAEGKVDLAVLGRLQKDVERAARASDRAQALVRRTPRVLLPAVSRGVGEVRVKVNQVDRALKSAHGALVVAPKLLGEGRPQRWFVVVQNNAEARATGGLIGAYAIVATDQGRISLERTGTNAELRTARQPVASDPKSAKLWRTLGSTGAWYGANLTPHFPDAASNIAGLWAAQSGQRVEGVLALDLFVLAELLRATGPVALSDGTVLNESNVNAFVSHDEYVKYPDLAQRKNLLRDIAELLFQRIVQQKEPLLLLRAFARIGQSGHFFAWSRDVRAQAELERGRVGGALPATSEPYLSVLTQNFAGNKLDYYVRRRISVKALGGGQIQLDVSLRNITPDGLPPYMTFRSDGPVPPVPYGQAGIGFTVYAAASSEVLDVRVNGRPAGMAFDRDHGHRLGTMALELPRGAVVTVSVRMTQPKGILRYRQQPVMVPDQLDLAIPHSLE